MEEVINNIGFGTYQKRLMALGGLASVLTGAVNGILVFLTYSPRHRCVIPGMENDTYNPVDSHHKQLINLTIPEGEEGFCEVFVFNSTKNLTTPDAIAYASSNMMECNKWVYDTSLFTSTIVTEYNFVCNAALKIAHLRMLFFAGVLVGVFICGLIGDLFGRKTSYLVALVIFLASNLTLPWISNPEISMALIFFNGFGGTAILMNVLVTLMEFVEKKKRVLAATMTGMGWVVGFLYVTLFAYFIRDWRTLQTAAFYPFVLFLSFIWFFPESVRWLVARGKYKEAESILRKAAKVNNVALKDLHLDRELFDAAEGRRESLISVIRSPLLLKRFLISAVNWVAVSLVYFGLTLNSGNLSGDLFVEFLSATLMEVPVYFLVFFVVDRVGRKPLHITLMCCGGLSCILTIFPVVFNRTGLQPLTVALATIGKATITAAFQLVFIYTPELFPTPVRMSVLGASSCLARLGGMAAPYIAEMGKMIGGHYRTIIPLMIFGGFTLLAGLLCIFLPETKGKELPETVQEAKRLTRQKQKKTDNADGLLLRRKSPGEDFKDSSYLPTMKSV